MSVLRGRLLNGRPWLVSASAIGAGTTPLGTPAMDTYRVFQRDVASGNPAGFATAYGKGWGAVPVSLAAAGALASVVLKLRLRAAASPGSYASPGTVIQDWMTVAGVGSLSAGANAIGLTLPAGPAFYLVDLALATDMANGITVAGALGVGSVTVATGQSICTGFFTHYQYYTPVPSIAAMVSIAPGGLVYAPYLSTEASSNGGNPLSPGAATWQPPGDYGSSPYATTFAAEYLRLATNQLGVVAALVGDGRNGASILGFGPNNSFSAWTKFKNVLAHCGFKFDSFIWCQGSTDAGNEMRRETYRFQLGQILDDLAAAVAAVNPGWTYGTTLSPIPGWYQHDDRTRSFAAIQYACQDLAAARPRVTFNCATDAGFYVNGHPTMLSRIRMARQHHRIVMGQLGAAKGGFAQRQGPSLTGAASRAAGSKVIKLTVAQNGGTALRAWTHTEAGANATAETVSADTATDLRTAYSLFSVFPAGVTDPVQQLALDATTPVTIASATEIWLTLAALPADAAGVDVWYQTDSTFTTAGMPALRDDATDGDGIAYGREMQATRIPVSVPAPTPAATALATLTAVPGQATPGIGGLAMATTGSGYTTPPAASLSGGGGTGAAALLVAGYSGPPQHAIVTNPGSGYSSPPTVTVSPISGGGSGGAGVAMLMVPPAAGALTRVWGAAPGAPVPAGIEVSVDGGAFAAPGSLVIRSDGTWCGTIVAPAAGSGHTIAARRAGGSAGAAVTFTTVSIAGAYPAALQGNLVALFDAAQIGTMWQDTARTVAPADLAPIRYMADATGHPSNDVLAGSADPLGAPFLELNSQNGLPGVGFTVASVSSGVGRTLRSPAGALLASALQGIDCTILTVYRVPGSAKGDAGMWTLGRNSFIGNDYSGMLVGDNGRPRFSRWPKGSNTVAACDPGGGSFVTTPMLTVARFQASTGAMKFAIGGYAELTATMTGTLGTDWDTVSLGSALPQNGYTSYADGRLHEAAFFNRLATDAERDALLAGAAAKWGG